MIAISRVIEPPQPRAQADVEEALHHDLAGQRARSASSSAPTAAARPRTACWRAAGRAAASAACTRPRCPRRARARSVERAAATIRIAALMNSADISAIVESMVANRIASACSSSSSVYLRVCTIDECRYRLCGITVAPRIADRDVEHLRVADDLAASARSRAPRRRDPAARATARRRSSPRSPTISSDDQRLDVAEAAVLQRQHDQHVERGEAHAPEQRKPEEQVERDRRAEHLGQVAGRDRDLAQHPEHDRRGRE